MKNIFLILILFCFLPFSAFNQSVEIVKATGKIPKEFITPSADKYKKKIVEIEKNPTKGRAAKKEQKDKKQFLLESSFSIDDLLQSGYILFNDQASQYVNKVLQKLPMSSRLKKSKPRAYLLNSNEVNAFATEQGIIFVSAGLLANLEDEAQLAFILSHELAHIEHKHGIDKFLKSKAIDSKDYKKNLRKIGLDKGLFSESMYSRKLEQEADDIGLELFLKSEYNHNTIKNVFEILHYADLPFELKTFPNTFFNDAHYKIPEDYWRSDGDLVRDMDSEEDESDTHPSAIKRMKKMDDALAAKGVSEKATFLVGKNDFFKVRNLMRYQLPFLAMENLDFGRALFNAFLLEETHPNDLALKKVIGKSLYYKSKFRNQTLTSNGDVKVRFENDKNGKRKRITEENNLQQVDYLFYHMSRPELLALALKYNYQLQKEQTDDREIDLIVEDLFTEIHSQIDDLSEFSSVGKIALDATDTATGEKTESIRKQKITDANLNKSYWKYAFVEEKKEKAFTAAFSKGKKAYDKREKLEKDYQDNRYSKKRRKELKKEEKYGKALGISKIAVVNPFYLALDERKDNTVQYIRSEVGQNNLRELIKEVAKASPMKVELLDITDLSVNEVEKFNDIVTIEKYVSQQFQFDDLTLTPSSNQNGIDAVAEKYGTDYFLYTGIMSLREKERAGVKLAYGLLLYPLLPFVLVDVFNPDYDMLYYAILFDVKTGRRSILKMDYFESKDSDFMVKSHTYDVFYQINRKAKR